VVRFTSAGSHEVKLTINGGLSKTTLINVSGFDHLDILGLPLAGTVGASGLNGHSNNNISALANSYKYSTTHLIAGVNISFRLARPLTSNSTIRVKVWASERGVPGRELHSQTVKISDLIASNTNVVDVNNLPIPQTLSPNYFYFDKPVQVPANSSFYVGIEFDIAVPFVATAPRDNISIHHVNSPAGGPGTAMFFNNSWQANLVSWTFAIFPIVANAAEYPAGTFAVSTKEACVNNAVTFNASSITNAAAYRWAFGNGATATEPTTSATYTAAGTFMPTLTATRNVNITEGSITYPVELRQSFSQMVRVADCSTAPVASFQASALSANVGSTITFSNTTTNATSYEWLISQGGTRIRSTEESPVVTFATRGKYDVTLIARNPTGEVAQTTKRQYVEIFATGQNCGTVNFPFPTRLTSFGAAAGGTFSGHNGNRIANYAKAFDLTAGTTVTRATLNILAAAATAPAASFITVNVWNAEGPAGTPGQVISSAKVSYTKLRQAVANNRGNIDVVLDQHVALPVGGRIYVGYTINYSSNYPLGDNLVVGSTLAGPNMGDRSLFLFNGVWYTLKEILGIQSEYAIAISTLSNIDQLPIASFTVSASKVAVGQAISLDASSSKKAQVYNWEAVGGTLTSMGETAASVIYDPTKAAVSFSKPGVYDITLVVMGDCGAKVATKTMQVEVGSGALAKGTGATSQDNKVAGVTGLSASESVVYPNPSTGRYNVVLKGEAQQKALVSVLNMTGKEVSSKSITLTSDSEVHQIDLASKPTGIYMLRVTVGNKVQVYRIAKI
jgi:PKD repeat protein